MNALILGASGQDGYYLAEVLRTHGIEPICVSRTAGDYQLDVADFRAVEQIIASKHPAYIFHLAACSRTQHCELMENHNTISTGTLNVLEAVRVHCRGARVFITGSAVQFENTGAAIDENTPFEGSSPYAVARIQSVYAARYFRTLGLQTYVGYLFHHESPRRGERHVSRIIADAARRVARGDASPLTLGDLSVVKEWTFAGDTVRAMLMLVQQDSIHEAVIGTGEGHSIRDWLDECFSLVGLNWRDYVRERDDFRAEYHSLVSNPARIKSLGWLPMVGFGELARLVMEAGH
jgi:GDPmannose 4,6-dehydratase